MHQNNVENVKKEHRCHEVNSTERLFKKENSKWMDNSMHWTHKTMHF